MMNPLHLVAEYLVACIEHLAALRPVCHMYGRWGEKTIDDGDRMTGQVWKQVAGYYPGCALLAEHLPSAKWLLFLNS